MKLVSVYKQPLLILLMFFTLSRVNAQQWSLEQCIDTAQVYNKSLQMSRNSILSRKKRKQKQIFCLSFH